MEISAEAMLEFTVDPVTEIPLSPARRPEGRPARTARPPHHL